MIDGHVVVIGGGGHARVLLDALSSMGVRVAGVVAPSIAPGLRAPLLGDDSWLLEQDAGKVLLVNALGSTSNTAARAAVFDRFEARAFALRPWCTAPPSWRRTRRSAKGRR
jgi:hypothetical protein